MQCLLCRIPPNYYLIPASAWNYWSCHLIRSRCRWGFLGVVPWILFPLKTCKWMRLFVFPTYSTYTGGVDIGEPFTGKGRKQKTHSSHWSIVLKCSQAHVALSLNRSLSSFLEVVFHVSSAPGVMAPRPLPFESSFCFNEKLSVFSTE